MLYSIVGTDVPNSLNNRKSTRPAHLARLTLLNEAGRLVIAGPNPSIDATDPGPAGFSGSLIIAEFPSLEEAQKWANADPYITAGVYTDVIVKPFIQVLP